MDRPILFKDEMVQAILEGRKTQTRRILDLPTGWDFKASDAGPCILGKITSPHPKKNRFGAFIRREIYKHSGKFEHDIVPCKYGEPGDRLWVREAFQYGLCTESTMAYRATHKPSDLEEGWYEPINWRPSIHMPRWASRITLEITDVRVERLQDISGEDCAAEGVTDPIGSPRAYGVVTDQFAREQFTRLWQSINGADSWDANPWVWVIEFRRVD